MSAITPISSSQRSAPFYLALLLLVLSLMISLAEGWVLYNVFRKAKEDELNHRLIAIGRAAEGGILASETAQLAMLSLMQAKRDETQPESNQEWRDWFRLLEESGSGLDPLRERLAKLKESANLTSVILITPEKRVLSDADNRYRPGVLAPLVDVDLYVFEPSLQGMAQSVPYYERNGIPHKRVYVPIRLQSPEEVAGKVGAVLRLEASLEAFQEIATLRGQVLMLSAVVAGLMVTVALIFHRLIRLLARVEANAAHRDRLQAMGLLTAGIAHEIRNPLGIIRSLAEAIQGDFSEDDPGREMMGDIVGEVERLNQLVTQYLAFARPDMAAGEGFAQPADIVRAVANLVQKDKRETSPIEIQIDSELPVVTMGATALKQVLLNLVMNAREASPPEKPIRIRGRALRGGSEVEIEVADQGPGISPRDLKRVFDPFFTTKTRGSGLGLPICRFLVDECKGQISIQSEPGKGTSARVVLPAQRKS